jgi:hypothetical protein
METVALGSLSSLGELVADDSFIDVPEISGRHCCGICSVC